MFRHIEELRLDEKVIADGQGGLHSIVPRYLKTLSVAARREAEPSTLRVLMEESIKMIPVEFSPWAKYQVEMCIRAHNPRLNCANQRTYRLLWHRRRVDTRPAAEFPLGSCAQMHFLQAYDSGREATERQGVRLDA
jgi:hypothetical protein